MSKNRKAVRAAIIIWLISLLLWGYFAAAPLLSGIDVVIAAPVKEEIFFRLILQSWLKDKIRTHGRGLAVLLSSLLFAFAHSGFSLEILPYLTGGIILGLLYEVTGNISLGILYHAFGNLIVCLPYFLGW